VASKDDKEINAAIRRATSTGSEGFIKKLERILRRDLFSKKGGRLKKNNMGSVPMFSLCFSMFFFYVFYAKYLSSLGGANYNR